MASSGRRPLPLRVLLALASGLCFVVWGVGATLLAWVVLPLVGLFTFRQPKRARIARAQRITASGNAWLMRLMDWFHIISFDRKTRLTVPDGPFVLVSNHPTLIDVCAITTIHPEICVIAKPKMTRSLFVGRALRAAGHIEAPGRRGSAFGGAAVIQGAIDRLERGFPVLVFPEGTRSPSGSVGKLSRGAFEIAKRADVPIVCALITADPPTLNRGMRWYSLPKNLCHYTIECLPAVRWQDIGEDSREITAHFQEVFANHAAKNPVPVTEASAEATQQAGATP